MHNQETNVPFSQASGKVQRAGIFSPSFPNSVEWSSCVSARNPLEGLSLCSPLPTPRRKLSLDALDDSTQSPPSMESIDSGECLLAACELAKESNQNPACGPSCSLLFLLLLFLLYFYCSLFSLTPSFLLPSLPLYLHYSAFTEESPSPSPDTENSFSPEVSVLPVNKRCA